MSRQNDIKQLIVNHERRLQKLEEKKATLGINTSPETLIEIEDIQVELEQLKIELAILEDSSKYTGDVEDENISNITHTEGCKTDWGDSPDIYSFFGRNEELTILKKWILDDKCRIVAITGIRGIGKTSLLAKLGKGGIGKTDLSLKFAYGIKDEFDYVIWRKLINSPPLEEILKDLIFFLSDNKEVYLPEKIEDQIDRLLDYLRRHRCLLILDNVESILKSNETAGQYQNIHEAYGLLFQRIGLTSHNSCLILTTREKPVDIVRLEGKSKPVRALELTGLKVDAARQIFEDINSFDGLEEEWEKLVDFYDGNPLALELVARHIQEVFFGSISGFIEENRPIFDDLNSLLDWHFERLNNFEKEILYWLAINREPVTLAEIRHDLTAYESKKRLTSSLQSLRRRLPIENTLRSFSLQPVLIEYVTIRLVEKIGEEIKIIYPDFSDLLLHKIAENIGEETISENLDFIDKYTLLKTNAKDFVRESQVRLIINPIIERLSDLLGDIEGLEAQLKNIIALLKEDIQRNGYTAGNILNLLRYMNADLTEYDFSGLTIRQAYLQGVNLHRVNFLNTEFIDCRFTETFGSVLTVDFSSDRKLLALGTANKEIRLYDLDIEKQVATFRGHDNWVWAVKFSPDGKMLASSSYDNSIRIWDISASMCLRVLDEHSHTVWAVAFSPDSKTLVSVSSDTTLKIWDVHQGTCLKTLSCNDAWIRCVAFHPDGQKVFSAGDDLKVRLWDIDLGECIETYEGHEESITTIAVNSAGTKIASAGNDKSIRIWDIQSGNCTHVLLGHLSEVRSIVFSPNNDFLVSGSSDTTIRLWDLQSGACIKTLSGHKNWVMSVAISSDGKTVASGSSDWTLRFWDTQNGHLVQTIQGYTNSAWSVALDPEGKMLASGYADNLVRLWNLETRKCVATFEGHKNWVMAVAFSADGNTIASGSSDSTICLWNLQEKTLTRVLRGHSNVVWSLDFHPSKKILASGSADSSIKLWNINTQELTTLQGHLGPVRRIAFGTNGILASCSEDRTIRLWDIEQNSNISILEGHNGPVWGIAFNSECTLLASCSGDLTVKLWDLNTDECIRTFEGHKDSVRHVRFSQDSQLLISASSDKRLNFWDISTGECIQTIEHDSQLTSLAINYDLELLVSSTDNGEIKLWNLETTDSFCVLTFDKPYQDMNIKGVRGLTNTQKDILKMLGAIEE